MLLSEIFTIENHEGLFKLVGPINKGFIVESLVTRQRVPVTESTDDAYNLAQINIFTTGKSISLLNVFILMKANAAAPVDEKADDATLKTYFKSILPHYDAKRVFTSDIKRAISWYRLLEDKVDFSIPVAANEKQELA